MTTVLEHPQRKENRPGPGMAAEGVPVHDAVAVNTEEQRKLYQARVPIYPKLVRGPFRQFKWIFLVFSLTVYYGLPWLRWPRAAGEPDQAVLVDFANARFYFFWIEIWPQEIYYITGLLIISALLLFLVTALFGRVWCGYACPQTVWTDLFIAVERWLEGDRNARMRLDKAAWTFGKMRKRVAKHAIWLLIAFATGGAWILYFHDAPTVFQNFFAGEASASAYIFAGILTFTTYSLAGLMREQVCTYMCPWPRIQGAMTDSDSLAVTYRFDRGEPRGPHKKGEPWDGRGDCIDCKACVAACPMGIDIRDGDQLECINCALCIDACDDIMNKVGRPTGLIAYDTWLNAERRARGEPAKVNLIRTRTVFYTIALALVSGIMLFGLSTRTDLELNVLRDRNPNYVTLSDGGVRNGYTLKITNKLDTPVDLRLYAEGPAGLSLDVIGGVPGEDVPLLTVPADKVESYRVFVSVPAETAAQGQSLPLTFRLEGDGEAAARSGTVLITGAG